MKSSLIVSIGLIIVSILLLSGINNNKSLDSHNFPPTNCTGAPNQYTCQFCHSTYQPNMSGGGVSITGIPSTFSASTSYPFSIHIIHSNSDRKKFGYDITALDAQGNQYGTFTTKNSASTVNWGEITSHDPPSLSATNQTTVSGFIWNTPSTLPSAAQLPITFYFCGNACDFDGTVNGDYVYTDSFATNVSPLAFTFKDFNILRLSRKCVSLSWSTIDESNIKQFIIERSYDNLSFYNIKLVSTESTGLGSYNFNDTTLNSYENIYYRIKYENKDGKFGYSLIQKISSLYFPVLNTIYPNPINRSNILTIDFNSDESESYIAYLLNIEGKKVHQINVTSLKGKNNLKFPIPSTLSEGLYYLVISNKDKIIIKNSVLIK